MLTLYPHISPAKEYSLPADHYSLHVEESGNPEGLPVLVLHDGPGIGAGDYYRRLFDAERYRIIQFDQRGSGQSLPLADLNENSLPVLLQDIEAIRRSLGIDKWLVLGYGWGAFLALNYYDQHADSVLGLVLGSVFLGRQQDVSWFSREGIGRVFPDEWRLLEQAVPLDERGGLLEALYRRVTAESELERLQFAKLWAHFMARCSTLHPSQSVVDTLTHPHIAISLARLQLHFWVECLSAGFDVLTSVKQKFDEHEAVPLTIVHGRYNILYPLESAEALQRIWPGAELQIIRDAGHSMYEPAIVDALLRACEQMGERLEPQTA